MAKVLFLGVALAVLQQWCGINVIFNYAQEIFAAAGYQISGILFNIVTTGESPPGVYAGCRWQPSTATAEYFCCWVELQG